MTEPTDEVVGLRGVSVVRSGNTLLDGIEWHVRSGERWVLLGPNGSGKTTLMSVAATYLWPSRGTVSVLGRSENTFGSCPFQQNDGPRPPPESARPTLRSSSPASRS
jgi:iron complex transport system ATP-binding protein